MRSAGSPNNVRNFFKEKFNYPELHLSDYCVQALLDSNVSLETLNCICVSMIQYASERNWGTQEVLEALVAANGVEGFDWTSVLRGDWRNELSIHNIGVRIC